MLSKKENQILACPAANESVNLVECVQRAAKYADQRITVMLLNMRKVV